MQQVFVVLAGAAVALYLLDNEAMEDGAVLVAVLFLGSAGLLVSAVILGAPFGSLRYTSNLGPLLGGLIPVGVPFLWTALAGGALAASRVLQGPPRGGRGEVLRLAVTTATLATLIGLSLDPVARLLRLWSWDLKGSFHGVPFVSFVGWWTTTLVLAMAAFTFAPGLRLLRGRTAPGAIGVLLLLQALVLGVALRAGLAIPAVAGGSALLLLLLAFLRSLLGGQETIRARPSAGTAVPGAEMSGAVEESSAAAAGVETPGGKLP
jgi:uncharacterized membrane protein